MIHSVRFEAHGDQPEQVIEAFNLAFDRLALGVGSGDLLFGASELVIEGAPLGGYKGRIKINCGPMGAAAENLWREGKDPYGADREEMERLRNEMNAAAFGGELFDPPPPGGDLYPPPFPMFTKLVFVQGKPYAIMAAKDCSITEFISEALRQSNTVHGTVEWELRDAEGMVLIAPPANPEEAGEPLSLDPRAGHGG